MSSERDDLTVTEQNAARGVGLGRLFFPPNPELAEECRAARVAADEMRAAEAAHAPAGDVSPQLVVRQHGKPVFSCRLSNPRRPFDEALDITLERIRGRLLEKNALYGNSALEPVRAFSKAGALEQLDVRIDDKISRVQSGQPGDQEDAAFDLLGYLVLREVAKTWVPS